MLNVKIFQPYLVKNFTEEIGRNCQKNGPSPQPSLNRGVSKKDGQNFDTIFDRADIYEGK